MGKEETNGVGHPASTTNPKPASAAFYGGQAVLEGVMMRGVQHFAVACRRADGTIALTCELVPKVLRPGWQKLPLLRGGFALVDSMALGTKALFWAAKVAEAGIPTDTPEVGRKGGERREEGSSEKTGGRGVTDIAIGSALVVGLGMAVFLFKILPQFIVEGIKHLGTFADWQLGLMDVAIRFTIFFSYILLISRMPHVYRLFQYHGAEHKAINAWEHSGELTVDAARAASRLHPRCGTSFLVIVILLSVLAVVPFYGQPLWARVLIQLAFVMPVAGVAFEMLRLAGKFRDNPVANALSQPGMWTQYLTTREPDDSHLEVALASLRAVMDAEAAEKSVPLSVKETKDAAAVA